MPLTAEEKKQRKLEKKAQKLREAKELEIKIRKDELAREVETSMAVTDQHRLHWYKENYEAKFPVMKADMEAAWRWYEHTLDTKDFIASHLLDTLDEVKMQTDMSWQDFSLKMDHLIKNFHQRIQNMDEDYETDKTELLEMARRCQFFEEDKQAELEEYYKTVIFFMEEKFQEASAATQAEYLIKRDEETKKGIHLVDTLSGILERNLKNAMQNILNTFEQYKEETEPRRKEVEALKAKDDYYIDMIIRQESRMAKLCDQLSNLQSQVNEKHESKLQLEDLKKDRDNTYSEYMAMRARLTREATHDSNQLLTLTAESNHVLQDLEKVVEKGEKILRLGVLCNRLETQEEKVIPFGFPAQLMNEEDMDDCNNPFRLFWRRYARVNVIKEKLEKVHEDLVKENKDLTEQLQFALEIIAQTRV